MSTANKQLVQRVVEEVWNRGSFEVVDELAASDIVVHATTPEAEIHGSEGVKQFYRMLRAGFPDIHFTIDDQIAEGDRVVTRWHARGSHLGEFMGIPPTNRQAVITGIDIDRIAHGKVVECWPNADELSLMQQLGIVPASV